MNQADMNIITTCIFHMESQTACMYEYLSTVLHVGAIHDKCRFGYVRLCIPRTTMYLLQLIIRLHNNITYAHNLKPVLVCHLHLALRELVHPQLLRHISSKILHILGKILATPFSLDLHESTSTLYKVITLLVHNPLRPCHTSTRVRPKPDSFSIIHVHIYTRTLTKHTSHGRVIVR